MHLALERLNELVVKSREKTLVANPFTKHGFTEAPTAESMETAINIGMDYAPALIAALVEIERCANGGTYAVTATIVNEIINRHLEPLK